MSTRMTWPLTHDHSWNMRSIRQNQAFMNGGSAASGMTIPLLWARGRKYLRSRQRILSVRQSLSACARHGQALGIIRVYVLPEGYLHCTLQRNRDHPHDRVQDSCDRLPAPNPKIVAIRFDLRRVPGRVMSLGGDPVLCSGCLRPSGVRFIRVGARKLTQHSACLGLLLWVPCLSTTAIGQIAAIKTCDRSGIGSA